MTPVTWMLFGMAIGYAVTATVNRRKGQVPVKRLLEMAALCFLLASLSIPLFRWIASF